MDNRIGSRVRADISFLKLGQQDIQVGDVLERVEKHKYQNLTGALRDLIQGLPEREPLSDVAIATWDMAFEDLPHEDKDKD